MNARKPSRSDGSILIVVILSLLAAGLIGVAALRVSTSTRYERVGYSMANRAHYLAESGATYVRSRRQFDKTFLPTTPMTLTLENQDQFTVVASLTNRIDDATTNLHQHLLVTSVGIVNPGTALEAREHLHFDISERGLDTNALPITFIDDKGKFNEDLWDLDGVVARVMSTGPAGGDPALQLQGEEGQMNLAWQNKPGMDLVQVWSYYDGLLSYDMQAKTQPFDTGDQSAYSEHYMLGLSFRVNTNPGSCYGLSFFRSLNKKPSPGIKWPTQLPAPFQALRGTNIYVVLWYRPADIGSVTNFVLLKSRRLVPSDGLLAWRQLNPSQPGSWELRDYSTLLLELKEKYASGSTTNRENHISVYTQNTSVYPRWSDGDPIHAKWQESTNTFPAKLTWDSGESEVVDSRATSAGFGAIKPTEVAIHVYYDMLGASKQFFDDFALRVPFTGNPFGGTQIQY